MPDTHEAPKRALASMGRDELLEYASLLEQRIDDAQKGLGAINDCTTDGYWDWHIQDEYEYMSPRFWQVFGYDPAEMRHHPSEWQRLIDPEDLPEVLELFDQHVRSRGEVPFDRNVRYRHKLGHWVTVRCRGRVTEWGPGGEPLRMVGTHTDMTHLIEERTRAEFLYLSSSVGIWDWIDVEGDREYWSPPFYRLLGYEPGEIPAAATTFFNLLHPDDRERTSDLVLAHLAGEAVFDIDYRLRTKSGEYRWFHAIGEAQRDAEGKAVRMVGSIQDVHARHLAEEELQTLTVRHKLSLKASNIGVWDWNVVTNELVWDEQMYGLYGIRPEEFHSAYEAWRAGVHPDDRERGDAEIEAALEDPDTPFDTELRVVHPSGEVRRLRAIATTVRDADGTPLRVVGVNWDITDEMRVQEELRRANDDLTQFAYRTSHDLKAPLVSIESLIEFIGEDLEAGDLAEVRANMQRMARQAGRLVALVNDILSLTSAELAEAGLQVVSMQSLLNEVLQDVEETLPGDRVRSRIEVQGPFDAPLPAVRLRQVIGNLVSNSHKYSDPDEPAPFVRVSAVDHGRSLHLRVEDNGRGIPAEHHERVFQLFKRFHPEVLIGSGLGLSIVKRHIERLHGTIDFESSPAGTSFDIKLPYRQP